MFDNPVLAYAVTLVATRAISVHGPPAAVVPLDLGQLQLVVDAEHLGHGRCRHGLDPKARPDRGRDDVRRIFAACTREEEGGDR